MQAKSAYLLTAWSFSEKKRVAHCMHTIPEIQGPDRIDIRNVVILVIDAQFLTNNQVPPRVWQGMILHHGEPTVEMCQQSPINLAGIPGLFKGVATPL